MEEAQKNTSQAQPLNIPELLPDIGIQLPLDGPSETRTLAVNIEGELIWQLHNAFQHGGAKQVFAILAIDKAIRRKLEQENILDVDAALATIWEEVAILFTDGMTHPDQAPSIEVVLGFTYRLLRGRIVSYGEAASIASTLLGREVNIDSWRIRVDRWRMKQKLPPVTFRNRGKREEIADDAS